MAYRKEGRGLGGVATAVGQLLPISAAAKNRNKMK